MNDQAGHSLGFEIVGAIHDLEVIAVGRNVRELARLIRLYGRGRWRKMKGIALVRPPGAKVRWAELHWYAAHGIGRVEFKRKRYLD